MTAPSPRSQPSRASLIYADAVARAMRDHKRMVSRFMRGKIAIAGPSGLDRERDYIIKAFDAALNTGEGD